MLRGDFFITEEGDAGYSGGAESGQKIREFFCRHIGQMDGRSQGNPPLSLFCCPLCCLDNPFCLLAVEMMIGHGQHQVGLEAAPVLVYHAGGLFRTGEYGTGGYEPVAADFCGKCVEQFCHALQPELFPVACRS